MKINEANVTLMVKNMDKSIQFYEMLGLKLKHRWENHYAMMEAPGVVIGLHPADGEPEGSGDTSIGFMIDDIKEAKNLLKKNEIKFKEEDGKSGAYLHFKDPNKNQLYFSQPKWKYE